MCQQPLCEFLVMVCLCCVCAVNVAVSVVSGVCAVLSSTGKLPAPPESENNAHKRLSAEASGADVFHMPLNGAITK